jgi:hypothetical protein
MIWYESACGGCSAFLCVSPIMFHVVTATYVPVVVEKDGLWMSAHVYFYKYSCSVRRLVSWSVGVIVLTIRNKDMPCNCPACSVNTCSCPECRRMNTTSPECDCMRSTTRTTIPPRIGSMRENMTTRVSPPSLPVATHALPRTLPVNPSIGGIQKFLTRTKTAARQFLVITLKDCGPCVALKNDLNWKACNNVGQYEYSSDLASALCITVGRSFDSSILQGSFKPVTSYPTILEYTQDGWKDFAGRREDLRPTTWTPV